MERVSAPNHISSYIENLKATNSTLNSENRELKEKIEMLQEDLESRDSVIKTLQNSIDEYKIESEEKSRIIKDKDKIIETINSDLDSFSIEIDLLINALGLNRDGKEPFTDFFKNRQFGQDRELLAGINIDNNFLKESSLDVIKYYLHTVGATIHNVITLESIKINNRRDLLIVIQALSKYIEIRAQKEKIEIEGVLEIYPKDIFNSTKIEYYSNIDIVGYLDDFIIEYDLDKDIRYGHL